MLWVELTLLLSERNFNLGRNSNTHNDIGSYGFADVVAFVWILSRESGRKRWISTANNQSVVFLEQAEPVKTKNEKTYRQMNHSNQYHNLYDILLST